MPDKQEQAPQQPPQTDPFSELFYKIEATLKYIDKISNKPDDVQQAVVDALVADVLPGLQRLAAGMAKFVKDTVDTVYDIDKRITFTEQQTSELGDRVDALEPDVSVLIAEDAEVLANFVQAALGIISRMPASDQARQPMLELGKQALEIIKDAKVEEEEEEGDGDDGSQG